jgi:hypothetical protein
VTRKAILAGCPLPASQIFVLFTANRKPEIDRDNRNLSRCERDASAKNAQKERKKSAPISRF